MLTFRINGKRSFTIWFEVINLSFNPKITQENSLHWKFLQTCGRTHLRHSSPWQWVASVASVPVRGLIFRSARSGTLATQANCGKICSLGSSFLLASGLINVSHAFSQSNPPVATWKREIRIPGHHSRVSCVYFGFFYFHLVNCFGF